MEHGTAARVWRPETENWSEIADDVVGLEREAFGRGAFTEEYLAGEFGARENMIGVLTEGSQLIGFSIASPIERIDPRRWNERYETAYISDTVIAAKWRGRGLVGALMNALEDELRRRGFQFVERDAAVAHGYASSIDRAYAGRIIRTEGPHPSEWGPQLFFRISLSSPETPGTKP